jgi:uncharacterized membrane protein YccC
MSESAIFTVSQHNKPSPTTRSRIVGTRIVGILIGLLLLLFVYYYIRYDFLPKDFYTSHVVGKVAGFGVLFTVGTLWYWFKDWRKNRRKR